MTLVEDDDKKHEFIAYKDEGLPQCFSPELLPIANMHNVGSWQPADPQSNQNLGKSLDEADKKKIDYLEKMASLPQSFEQYKENLIMFMNMGFQDLSSNLQILKKNNNDGEKSLNEMFDK